MLTLYIDVAGNRILGPDALEADLPRFVHGDQVPVKLVFVDSNFTQIEPPTSVCVALSKLNQKPLDGTFTLTYGGDTTAAIAFGATAAQVSAALNALASITAAGGVTVSGTAGGPYSIVFVTAGARTAFTNDAELLYPASQIITNVEVTGTTTVRHRVTIGISRNPAAFTDAWTKVGVDEDAYLTGVLNLNTAGIESILNGASSIDDAVIEIQTRTGETETTVQRRDVRILNDMVEGAPSTPVPNSTWATLQQVNDAIEEAVDGIVAGEGGGSKVPEALTASRDLTDADADKFLFGSDVTVSLPGGGAGGMSGPVDIGASLASSFNWVTEGFGTLGYWLSRTSNLVSGVGASVAVTGGIRWSEATLSFVNPDGSLNNIDFNYIMPGGPMSYSFTLTQDTRVRFMLHSGNPGKGLSGAIGGFTFDFADPDDGPLWNNGGYYDIALPAGEHTVVFTESGDNPGISGILFDPYTAGGSGQVVAAESNPGPLPVGGETAFAETETGPITINPGGNTVITKNGFKTAGVGSVIVLKKLDDNLYILSGDTAT